MEFLVEYITVAGCFHPKVIRSLEASRGEQGRCGCVRDASVHRRGQASGDSDATTKMRRPFKTAACKCEIVPHPPPQP